MKSNLISLVLAMSILLGCSSGNDESEGGGGGGTTAQTKTIAGTSWESKSQTNPNMTDAILFYSNGTGTYSYAVPYGNLWSYSVTNFTYTSSGNYVNVSPAIEGSTSFAYYGGNTITIGGKTFTKSADLDDGGGGGGGGEATGSGYIRIFNNTSARVINEVRITRDGVSVAYDYSYSSKVISSVKSYEVPVGQCVVTLRDIQASKTWTKSVSVSKNGITDVSVYDSGWN